MNKTIAPQKNGCLHVKRMLKFVDLARKRSNNRVRISTDMIRTDLSWKTTAGKHRKRAGALTRLCRSLKQIDAYLARHPNSGASRMQESEFALARRQLQEEYAALVVCDARLGFELVRRENSAPKLYRKLQKTRQAVRNILATYKQEISEMDEPSGEIQAGNKRNE